MSKGHTHTTEAPEPVRTLDELLATLRNDAAEDIAYSPNDIRRLANQIESAAKRCYEEVKSYFEKLHDGPSMVCTAKNRALRNAAEDIVEQVKAEASLGHFAPAVVEDRAVGNAAAMLEALQKISHWIWSSIDPTCNDDCCKPKREFAKIADAALAAPARNCDQYATAEGAFAALRRGPCADHDFCKEQTDCAECAVRWLFTPEGGAK